VALRLADVAAVVRRGLAELRAVHPDREIELDAPRSAVAWVDPERLGQVVSNLVGNALEHGAPDARVRVEVAADRPGVEIRVHNDGPMIGGELSQLFEPFRQGPSAAGRAGAGLGLYIVREVLRAHGGTVEVSSSDADGTTFTVRLPPPSATTGRPAPDR
jgi:signal transduction histidine kinase